MDHDAFLFFGYSEDEREDLDSLSQSLFVSCFNDHENIWLDDEEQELLDNVKNMTVDDMFPAAELHLRTEFQQLKAHLTEADLVGNRKILNANGALLASDVANQLISDSLPDNLLRFVATSNNNKGPWKITSETDFVAKFQQKYASKLFADEKPRAIATMRNIFHAAYNNLEMELYGLESIDVRTRGGGTVSRMVDSAGCQVTVEEMCIEGIKLVGESGMLNSCARAATLRIMVTRFVYNKNCVDQIDEGHRYAIFNHLVAMETFLSSGVDYPFLLFCLEDYNENNVDQLTDTTDLPDVYVLEFASRIW